MKKYDVVIFGASGYTGRLVLDYFINQYHDTGVKFAVASRNKEKMNLILSDYSGITIDNIDVDSNDAASIQNLIDLTKVVVTTVGPYQLYGSEIVKACALNGVDYVDLCGEPAWMHTMIKNFKEDAIKSGSRILFSCGFDSIPFDLGVFYLQNKIIANYGKPANNVRGRVRVMQGEFSGGTAASFKATMQSLKKNHELFNVLANPFSLSEGFQGPDQPADNKPLYDKDLNSWVAPFFMAPINTKNIHRTNMLLNHLYGKEFTYNEMWMTGDGDEGKNLAKLIVSTNPFSSEKGELKPGDGPTKESRESGSYDILFCGNIDEKNVLNASVVGDMDPGYGSTSKMMAETAICIFKNTTLKGGIYTPAAALGLELIDRLEKNAGLTFKYE